LAGSFAHETGLAATAFMQNVVIEIPPRKKAGSMADVAARFPEYQFPPAFGELQHEPGRALCRWGEAGWGEIAMHGKKKGQFDARLVGASAKLIRDRWKPLPQPTWVSCVPSHAHPGFVPQFARDLALELGLPFVEAVKTSCENRPQKEMENTHYRCNNLDGAFKIVEAVDSGPVLLVDDAVDSGWTFAVVAALLRQAGTGPVFPFAVLSTTSSS